MTGHEKKSDQTVCASNLGKLGSVEVGFRGTAEILVDCTYCLPARGNKGDPLIELSGAGDGEQAPVWLSN
jgi:hypothetical protein